MSDTTTLRPGYEEPANSAFPKDWTVSRLDELCTFHQGGKLGITKNSGYVTSGVPAYSAAGQDGYVSQVEFSNTDGVILSAIGANCGRCFFASGDWTTLANVQAIIPSPSKLDAKYLYYRVNRGSYWPRSGSAQPFIKPSDIRNCWVAHPPVNQQKLIARILDTLDTQIQKTEALIAKLEKVKEGLLHDLLTRGIDDNGRLRPSPEHAPELYKESPLGLIPREWGYGSLGELSTSSVIGPFGSDLVASDYRPEGVPVVFVRDVVSKTFTWKSEVYVDRQKAASLSAHDAISGDVLLTKMGLPPCIACTYPSEFPEGIVTADIVRLRPDKSMVLPDWVSNYANSEHVASQVRAITSGVTRPKVTLSDVRSLKVAVPPLKDQRAILLRVSEASRRVNAAHASLGKLLSEKTGLMDDLLTGRVRVTPLLEQAQAATPA